MNIEIKRDTFTEKSTIGKMYINGVYFCETLEDMDRKLEEGGEKVYGKTCIPRGTYDLVIDYSPKYQRMMPHILDVPQFTGIRIHSGNAHVDTEGCILVGKNRKTDYIHDSRVVFAALFPKLDDTLKNGEKIKMIIA